MSAFQERIKNFRELPSLKLQLEEQRVKLESLEKIKNSVSSENYLSLSGSYEKTISGLAPRVDQLQTGISLLKGDIELDSKMLESENSLLEKELQELQFLSERGALSKQDYDTKRNTLQQKINKNKSNLSSNQSGNKELDFYATYVGTDNYLKHKINKTTGSIKLKFTSISPKVWISLGIIAGLILASFFLYKPVKAVVVEKIAWNKAVKENSYESFGNFLINFPNSKKLNTAKINQEEAKWSNAKKANTLSLFDDYIQVYPNSKHLNEANLFRDSLLWINISKSENLSWYTKYLSMFPNGKFVNLALTKITELSAANSYTYNPDNGSNGTMAPILVFDNYDNIYSSNIDGTNIVQLTTGTSIDYDPRINYSKTKIAFYSNRTGRWEIFTMNIDGTGVQQITKTGVSGGQNNGGAGGMDWTPDGKLLFTRATKICQMNADGTGIVEVATAPSNYWSELRYSPNGDKIIAQTQGGWGYTLTLYIMNIDGTSMSVFAPDLAGVQFVGCFSKDGLSFLYSYDLSGSEQSSGQSLNDQIISKKLDGSGTTNLSGNKLAGSNDLKTVYTPDGTKIIFTNNVVSAGTMRLWIMNYDGSNRQQLINTYNAYSVDCK